MKTARLIRLPYSHEFYVCTCDAKTKDACTCDRNTLVTKNLFIAWAAKLR